ncbi:MAG: helix-turn-helix transcriptional regulator [Flavobacteriaceae bacterium]
MNHRMLLTIFSILSFYWGFGQYQFTGHVSKDALEGKIYLSVVEDYRKISGVYSEQILNQTTADSLGHFRFEGDNLPPENKIYRIHLDTCSEEEQPVNHFSGHCSNSKEILFIANNTDTLSLPFGFEKEMFCKVVSKNNTSKMLFRIDSIKDDMKYAFATYRSEANRKMNTQKWFTTLQEYSKSLNEPLAEVYTYAFLSDRASDLHPYYLEDLKTNHYYEGLLSRLKSSYPEASYTQQYEAELKADEFLANRNKKTPWWIYFLGIVALLSVLGNFYFIGKWRQLQKSSKNTETLSKQEQKVMELILLDNSNKEIADALFVSVSTVKTHINNLYKKMGVTSREELKQLNIK